VPLLNDLKTDERIPLIARNHADRDLEEKSRSEEVLSPRLRIVVCAVQKQEHDILIL